MATATESTFRREASNRSSAWSRGEPEVVAAAAAAVPLRSAATISPQDPSDRAPPKGDALPPGLGMPSPADGADQGGGGNATAAEGGRKPAWSRPSNGVVEVGPVMGAVSWPALSEATKGSPKPSSSDSPKSPCNGSTSAPAPVISSSPPKQICKDINFSSSTNNGSSKPHTSMELGGSGSSGSRSTSTGGGTPPNAGQPPLPPSSVLPTSSQVSEDALDKPVTSQPHIIRELNHRNTRKWDQGSRGGGSSPQFQGGNENHRNYGNRRGNNGVGGVVPHHNNFVNRRGNYEWNSRSFGGVRDVKVQQQQPRAMARHFLQPLPPTSAALMSPPPPAPHFASPIGFYDIPSPPFYVPTHPSPESCGSMPFAGPPAMFYAVPDSQLRAILAKQIDYYFSPENLCKDIYLRQNMDREGWVSVSLIASFNRVRNLTNNIQLILDTVRTSTVVQVQGDKIRRRNDWMNWPPLSPAPNLPHSSIIPSYETLATHVRNVKLDEENTNYNSVKGASRSGIVLSRSSSELSSQSLASNGKGSGQITTVACPDQSVSGRSLDRSDTF